MTYAFLRAASAAAFGLALAGGTALAAAPAADGVATALPAAPEANANVPQVLEGDTPAGVGAADDGAAAAAGAGVGESGAAGLAEVGEASEERAGAPGGTLEYPLEEPVRVDWSFAGVFGTYDAGQLQRGFKVYTVVCSGCHSLTGVAFRNLAEEGGPEFSEDQARTVAAGYQIEDGPDATGQMFMRPGVLADRFPARFPNDEATRAAYGGALPPDLTLIAKARSVERGFPMFLVDIVTQYQEQGADYIYSLLTGYEAPPAGVTVQPGLFYNTHFISGSALAMPPPLADRAVAYDDGSPETLDQYARDVAAFLMWTAEPHLVERKALGFRVIIFLGVFAVLMYLTKRRIWRTVH